METSTAPKLKQNRKPWLKACVEYHRTLAWIGGIALLLFSLSAILHPLMSWTGPKAQAFGPPALSVTSAHIEQVAQALNTHTIESAQVIKVVRSYIGPVLQVTEFPEQPRRYFSLDTKEELTNFDHQYAVWLARHYTGLNAPIKNIIHQTRFDDAYPWVNRLLPVYRVEFSTPDNRIAYIHTELGRLTGHTNDWKTWLQRGFQYLHTWQFLDDIDIARVIIIVALVLCIIGMTITGFSMVLLFTRRPIAHKGRRLHRYLAYGIWLPLLLFSISGLYHLLYSISQDTTRGIAYSEPIQLKRTSFAQRTQAVDLPNQTFDQLSLVQGSDKTLLYRLQSVERINHTNREVQKQKQYYVNGVSGNILALSDKEISKLTAERLAKTGRIIHLKKVSHFGLGYDFRNKRLPVWKAELDSGIAWFIDPATGLLVDNLTPSARYEGYSFSFLHKWNVLTPITGRFWRDCLLIICMIVTIISTIAGFRLLIKRKKSIPTVT